MWSIGCMNYIMNHKNKAYWSLKVWLLSEETLTLATQVRKLANKIRLTGALRCGASEETLTLDLFLGKEAL